MIGFTWILAIISTLGVGGTIVAYFLFPAVVAPIVEGSMRALVACKACLVVILLIGTGIGSWWLGHHRAEADCQADEVAAAMQSKIDAANKDRDEAKAAAADAALRLAAIEQQSKEEQERTAEYVDDLEKRPVPACALNDDDLRGMRAPARARAARKRTSAGAARPHAAGAGAPAQAR